MIQRLQTIFLFLIAVIMLSLPFFDIWVNEDMASGIKYIIRPCTLQKVVDGNAAILATFPYTYTAFGATVVAAMSIYQIFQYKNRVRQAKIGVINSWIMVAILTYMFYLIFNFRNLMALSSGGTYKHGYLLVIVCLFLNSIATKFIKKDEQLVRSSSSIR